MTFPFSNRRVQQVSVPPPRGANHREGHLLQRAGCSIDDLLTNLSWHFIFNISFIPLYYLVWFQQTFCFKKKVSTT